MFLNDLGVLISLIYDGNELYRLGTAGFYEFNPIFVLAFLYESVSYF